MTFIIAICGTMGSGKTTAVENIAAALPDCEALHEDDFNRTAERSLEDIDAWWKRGANVGELDLSEVIKQLAVVCPDKDPTATVIAQKARKNTTRVLLLKTHFGRLHPALKPWIDYQCWIDVPADIAVARKVAQLCAQMRSHPTSSDNKNDGNNENGSGLRWIENFCKGYLTTTRKLFEMQRQKVRELSEMSIDGQGTPLAVCEAFLRHLPQRFKPE
ncbi:MAG: hypothetical protein O2856_07075 [Planctomycetota bacterium]|nr:hypothetical protein [Planctomycetota bacterium]